MNNLTSLLFEQLRAQYNTEIIVHAHNEACEFVDKHYHEIGNLIINDPDFDCSTADDFVISLLTLFITSQGVSLLS